MASENQTSLMPLFKRSRTKVNNAIHNFMVINKIKIISYCSVIPIILILLAYYLNFAFNFVSHQFILGIKLNNCIYNLTLNSSLL